MNPLLMLALLAGGASAALLLWWFVETFIAVRATAVNRMERDRPPAWWRLTWPIVLSIATQIAPWLSAQARFARSERLRRAGLEFALNAEQFVAGKMLAAFAGLVLCAAAWSPRGVAPFGMLVGMGVLGFVVPESWLRDRIEHRRRAVLRELPFYLDVITLSVESGLNLASALSQAVDKGPRGPLRIEFDRVLRDLRTGRGREEALRGMAERLSIPAIGSLVAALLVAEKQGVALGPVLRAQAEQRRNERFMRAEKLAMEAPVKMLPPLLVFIFPCTFVMLLFPVASRMIEEGWLR